ncbi:hypothetical protein [Microbacterium sp. Se63.02b]|nr:hypothetical protein [Microbacterium sp. Se63.02b]
MREVRADDLERVLDAIERLPADPLQDTAPTPDTPSTDRRNTDEH